MQRQRTLMGKTSLGESSIHLLEYSMPLLPPGTLVNTNGIAMVINETREGTGRENMRFDLMSMVEPTGENKLTLVAHLREHGGGDLQCQLDTDGRNLTLEIAMELERIMITARAIAAFRS